GDLGDDGGGRRRIGADGFLFVVLLLLLLFVVLLLVPVFVLFPVLVVVLFLLVLFLLLVFFPVLVLLLLLFLVLFLVVVLFLDIVVVFLGVLVLEVLLVALFPLLVVALLLVIFLVGLFGGLFLLLLAARGERLGERRDGRVGLRFGDGGRAGRRHLRRFFISIEHGGVLFLLFRCDDVFAGRFRRPRRCVRHRRRVIFDGAAFALRGRGVMRRGRALVHRQLVPDFRRFRGMHFSRGDVGRVVFRPHARTGARPVRRLVAGLAFPIVGEGIVELVVVRRSRCGRRLDRGERRVGRDGGGRRRRQQLELDGRRRAHAGRERRGGRPRQGEVGVGSVDLRRDEVGRHRREPGAIAPLVGAREHRREGDQRQPVD